MLLIILFFHSKQFQQIMLFQIIFFFLSLLIKQSFGCLANQFQSSGVCKPCHLSCLSCNGFQKFDCLQCHETRKLAIEGSMTSCLCMKGFVQSVPEKQSCQALKCESKCKTCQDQAFTCVACSQNRQLNTNCSCTRGFYQDKKGKTCEKCHYSCDSCNESERCLTCNQNKYRIYHEQTGKCACRNGYVDLLIQQCQQNSLQQMADYTIIIGICIPVGIVMLTIVGLLFYKKFMKIQIQKNQSNVGNSNDPGGSAEVVRNDVNFYSDSI